MTDATHTRAAGATADGDAASRPGAGKDAAGRVVGFPPDGWLTNRQTAGRLGVSLNTLTCNAWKWRRTLQAEGRVVRMPGGGRCSVYPVALVERLRAVRDAAAAGPTLPDGFVDADGARAFFGVGRAVWKNWVRQGRVRCGQTVTASVGGKRAIYAVADLEKMRDELFGEDKYYKRADQSFHVPAGFVRREEAWERFGVSLPTWYRWERQGTIACGLRMPGGPKLYRVEEIERLVAENGRLAPPYPDLERPGVVRVPLSGRDIKRREAIIDATDLPLIEGGSCSWSPTGRFGFVAIVRDGQSTPLRRVILGVTETNTNVRHLNDDPLDCRRENLVLRTIEQRVRNKRKIRSIKGRPTTSRFKGVFWEKQTKAWRATIRVGTKTKGLGRYGNELAAAEAYDAAARQYFGVHARLNFPDGREAWLAAATDADVVATLGRAA